MSDAHDNWDTLSEAVSKSNEIGCEYLLFAGDLMSKDGLYIISKFNGTVYFTKGNNDKFLTNDFYYSNKINFYSEYFDGNLNKVRVFMSHYPEESKRRALTDNHDLCVYGHTHIIYQKNINRTVLVNPGEIYGERTSKKSFMIYNAETKEVNPIYIS